MTVADEDFKRRIKTYHIDDIKFPRRLKNIPGCPKTIYVNGELPKEEMPSVAIIGARSCTAYGREIARSLARKLALNGVVIVSGMAYGIDSEAHKGAIEAKGKTLAVFGSGLNVCYPKSHFYLYENIVKGGGAAITEHKLGTKPLGRHFASRNRIISGLSDAVVVIEAKKKSGTQITVTFALEQGREVFVLPGRITDPMSKGCNDMIKQGANILTSGNDILEYLHLKHKSEMILIGKDESVLDKNQKILYSCLDFMPLHIDNIAEKSGFSLRKTLSILMELEILDFVEAVNMAYYRKI